ncbi:MAG: hypothetical protein J7K22_03590 [Nanoarchaeota archaeon]|nr:hypothetical protein [Nanoarchaeota archaeon]
MEHLSYSEIKNMSLQELILNKDKLPPEIDVSQINEENFEDFKFWLSFISSEEKKSDDFDYSRYFKVTYGSVPLLIGMHEGLHAIGAKISGGEFLGFGINAKGIYTLIEGDTKVQVVSSILPNIVLSTLGFYVLKQGIKNKDLAYIGVGSSALILNLGSFLFDYGDYFSIFKEMNFSNTTAFSISALLSTITFAVGYKLSSYFSKIKEKFLIKSAH